VCFFFAWGFFSPAPALFGFLITGWNLTGRSIYEVVKNFEDYKNGKEIPEKLKDTFDVLDTLDTVYNYVFRN